MSNRENRLRTQAEELRTREHIAQIRLANAERGLDTIANVAYSTGVPEAFQAEVNAARAALRDIHEQQQAVIVALDMHTTDYPDMAMIMVEAGDGYRVYERRDPDNTGTDETGWHPLNDDATATPMTFDEITGAVVDDGNGEDSWGAYTYYRIYTQDEVDCLLDRAAGL